MNDNWKFSALPYTSPDVEALQARYDALTQRAKDAQDPEDLLEVVRQRDALQQEVALCQSIATIRAFHDVTDEFYQRELQETLPRLETLDTQSLSMAIAASPYAAAVDEAFGRAQNNEPWRQQVLAGCDLFTNMAIYMLPRYVVSYALSIVCAQQLKAAYDADPVDGWARYHALCASGGSKLYAETLAAAGLELPYAPGVVERLARELAAQA